MKNNLVRGKAPEQGVHLVGILEGESRMARELLHPGERARQARSGLDTEPLVDDQRLILPCLVELTQRVRSLWAIAIGKRYQRCQCIGHVVRLAQLRRAETASFG